MNFSNICLSWAFRICRLCWGFCWTVCKSYYLHIGCIAVVICLLKRTVWMLWLTYKNVLNCHLNLYYGHCSGGVIAFSHCSINTPLSTNAFDVNGHIRKQRTRESVRINLGEEFLAAVLPKAFWLTQLIAAAHCKIGNLWRSSRHPFKKGQSPYQTDTKH